MKRSLQDNGAASRTLHSSQWCGLTSASNVSTMSLRPALRAVPRLWHAKVAGHSGATPG
ncbi:MAG: hypothetical protein AB2693_09675 [Candidatus Thiodiazotropha sp.]